MHQRVVLRAQQHQIVEGRLATVRPVVDVMAMQEAPIVTSWELATAIVPGSQCSLDSFWDDS